MDFFARQDEARRRTVWLVVLFTIAVVAIVSSVYAVVSGVLLVSAQDADALGLLLDPRMLAPVAGGTLALIGGGSVYKVAQLSGGGTTVAERLGGRPIRSGAARGMERRLLNVTEEMAIASGTPVPTVYLLDHESAINAFAAGTEPGNAVIGITRGALERLNRDELQGVIAHEFSHIVHGDTRLNVRLIGLLHGILLIGLIGSYILRSLRYTGYRRSSRSQGDNVMPLVLTGLGFIVVGSVGTFFGNVIKAAVSRQREYLADASAVQYTREPSGIAGALKKIGGFPTGGRVANPNAPEISHMFFAEGVRHWLGSALATHPPLPSRIRRLDPMWDGSFAASETVLTSVADPAATAFAGAAPAMASIGEPRPAHLAHAAALARQIPAPIAEAARTPYGARAVIYALVTSIDEDVRQRQRAHLVEHATADVVRELDRLEPLVRVLPTALRLPIVDVTLPSLRGLTPDQFAQFRSKLVYLMGADGRLSLFEWTLGRIVLTHLGAEFGVRSRPGPAPKRPALVLLSALARAGHDDQDAAATAVARGLRFLGESGKLLPEEDASLEVLDAALDVLRRLPPRRKRRVVAAAAATITTDDEVTVTEAELFRAIADTLGVPVPPLLAGQSLVGPLGRG